MIGDTRTNQKPYGGRLENWKWWDKVMVGDLYDDPLNRFGEGAYIHTSKILKFSALDNKIETLNTIYHLGRPAGPGG